MAEALVWRPMAEVAEEENRVVPLKMGMSAAQAPVQEEVPALEVPVAMAAMAVVEAIQIRMALQVPCRAEVAEVLVRVEQLTNSAAKEPTAK